MARPVGSRGFLLMEVVLWIVCLGGLTLASAKLFQHALKSYHQLLREHERPLGLGWEAFPGRPESPDLRPWPWS